MSAQRGALCVRQAMSFIFFPSGFLDAIFNSHFFGAGFFLRKPPWIDTFVILDG